MKIRDIMTPLKSNKHIVDGINGNTDIYSLGNKYKTFSNSTLEIIDNQSYKIGELNKELLSYIISTSNKYITNDILNKIEDGVVAIDAKGKIFFANHAYSKILGVPICKIIGKSMQKIEPGAAILDVLQTKTPINKEKQYIESLDKYVSVRIYPIKQNGALGGAVSIFTDTTELIKLNKEVERANEVAVCFQKQVEAQQELSKLKIIGKSPNFLKVVSQALVVSKTQASVLIRGENGSGKEMIAKIVHSNSQRKDRPIITVNCAAIPENLIESELFGYEEGAFTGAKHGGQMGKFELASGGTLFLDEIGDMPITMQSKLLRVLQEGEIEKIGRQKNIPVDVRLITATNQPLEKMINEKKFREDLYYRLNIVEIQIPPLRNRKEDIGLLASYFLEIYNNKYEKSISFSQEILSFFHSYNWPGNVREMKNCIEHAVIMCLDDTFKLKHLPPHINKTISNTTIKEKNISLYTYGTLQQEVKDLEKKIITEAIASSKNNKSKAMKLLGISRRTFYRKLKEYGINSAKK